MIKAYRFALDPTPTQEEAFRSHCGAQRFAYNWALARVQANWHQRELRQRGSHLREGTGRDAQTDVHMPGLRSAAGRLLTD